MWYRVWRRWRSMGFPVALLAASLAASPAASPSDVAERLAPSIVRVAYHLQFDGGDRPLLGGVDERCPNCGRFHGTNAAAIVEDERPHAVGGFVLTPETVLIPDPQVHPRFVRHIEVRDGADLIQATVERTYLEENAVLLRLVRPLTTAQPIVRNAEAGAPAFAVAGAETQGRWTTTVKPLRETLMHHEDGRSYVATDMAALITDAQGQVIGLAMNGQWDATRAAWPDEWPALNAAELADRMEAIETQLTSAVLTAVLRFRSPRMAPGIEHRMRMRYGDEDDEALEQHVPAVLLDARRALVLANLTVGRTSRLERIELLTADGEAREARFRHTLTDYGALVVEVDEPLPGAPAFSPARPGEPFGHMLMLAGIVIQRGQRKTHVQPVRIPRVEVGWKGMALPSLSFQVDTGLLMDTAGAVQALPLARRGDASEAARGYARHRRNLMVPVRYLAPVFERPADFADETNRPLSPEEEARVAWMGVDLQPLDRNLAEANQVSHLTEGGRQGAIVSHVHPGSPAAEAGIEPGWVLLHVQPEGAAQPLAVRITGGEFFGGHPFPWDRLDELPEQYYDEIPSPWPPVENELTTMLAEIGMGRPYRAAFFADGSVVTVSLNVAEGPRHFRNAASHRWEAAGLTVNDMTYEVGSYLNRQPEDPGVVLSRITPGSSASTAGLKPYEVITHVNDRPVHDAAAFGREVAQGGDIRLIVRRMARERVVSLTVGVPEG